MAVGVTAPPGGKAGLSEWTTQSYFVYAATVAAAGIVLIDTEAT